MRHLDARQSSFALCVPVALSTCHSVRLPRAGLARPLCPCTRSDGRLCGMSRWLPLVSRQTRTRLSTTGPRPQLCGQLHSSLHAASQGLRHQCRPTSPGCRPDHFVPVQAVNAAFEAARHMTDPNAIMHILHSHNPYHVQSLLTMFGVYRCSTAPAPPGLFEGRGPVSCT